MSNREITREDSRNLDHYIKHLEAHGVVPRKQYVGVADAPTDRNILKNGMPTFVQGISLSNLLPRREEQDTDQ
jgi:hypothetical protein